MIIETVVLILGLSLVAAQDSNCDFYQQILAGRTYTVNSPGWPGSYGIGQTCRWVADCPTGYNCRLVCSEINLPQSQSCSVDRFLVSLTGNLQLSDAQTYCGRGSLNVLSTGTRISMGLVTSNRSSGGRFTCQLSAEPSTSSCRCGDRRWSRIVGGVETGVNEFPSMVGIADVRSSRMTCGGVILSPWYVLSAAHCFVNESPFNYAVIVGEHDVTVGDSPATQAYRISSFRSHPWFTETNYDYDISIVTVSNAIVYSERVGPVCLPFKFANSDLAGARVTMLGWGTLFPGGPSSNTLQKVDVDVITQGVCRSQEPSITDRHMCTFTPGKDACQYDSGGPVLYTDPSNGRLYSVGIISYGRFCASGYPGINTRVTSLLNWIQQNTPGANYCNV
ncbi:venom serine protease-like isoform X2 [Anticarsia gemmatalis]